MTNIEIQPSELSKEQEGASPPTTKTHAFAAATLVGLSSTSSPVPQKASNLEDRNAATAGRTTPKTVEEESANELSECESSGSKKSTVSATVHAIITSGSSVFSEPAASVATASEKCMPSISLSATPTINVVCAPVVEEDNNKSVIIRNVGESETSGPNDGGNISEVVIKNDNQSVIESRSGAIESAAAAEHVSDDSLTQQLSLDVERSADQSNVAEDLSPSMDEYQECCPVSEYRYDSHTAAELLIPGCVAPAPTPSPLIAPLAEIEIYPADDEPTVAVPHSEEATGVAEPSDDRARSKKKKQQTSEKGEHEEATTAKPTEKSNRNDVCPWEDE